MKFPYTKGFPSRQFTFILLLVVLVRFLYLILLPPGQLPDEIFVFERIYSEAVGRISPEVLEGHTRYFPNNEYFHPPLYFWVNSFVLQSVFFLKGSLLPFSDSFLSLSIVFRLESLFLSLFSLVLIWRVIQKLALSNYTALSTLLFFSFLPTAAVFSNALNFHIAVFFMIALFIFVMTVKDWEPDDWKMAIVLGVIVGLTLLIRFEGAMLIPLLITYTILSKRKSNRWMFIGIFLVTALVISGWWYGLNYLKFGNFYDPQLVEATTKYFIKPFSFRDYFGIVFNQTIETFVFTAGRTNNLRLVESGYVVWKTLFLVATFGWFRILIRWKKLKLLTFKTLFLSLSILFLANVATFVYLNVKVNFSPQGRYFFPSLVFIWLFFIFGLSSWFNGKWERFLPILSLLFLLFYNWWGLGCVAKVYQQLLIIPNWLGCFNYPF